MERVYHNFFSFFCNPLKFSIHRSLHLQNRKTILLIPLLIRWLVESSSNWGLPHIKLISTYNESSYLRHSFRKLSFNRLLFNWSKINHYIFFFPQPFDVQDCRSLHLQNRKTILLIPLLIRWLVESSSNWGLPRIKLISTYNESSYLRHSFRKLSFNRLLFNWSKINHYIFFFPQPFDVQDCRSLHLQNRKTILLIPLLTRWVMESPSNWSLARNKMILV